MEWDRGDFLNHHKPPRVLQTRYRNGNPLAKRAKRGIIADFGPKSMGRSNDPILKEEATGHFDFDAGQKKANGNEGEGDNEWGTGRERTEK